MAPAATQAARSAAAPARSPRSPARRTPQRRPASPRTARARGVRPARSYSAPLPARLVPIAVGRTAGAFSGLADSGVMHRLTRGRLWIGALATLLVGIVGLNVVALSFNASSSNASRKTEVLQRQISTLRAQVAAAGVSNERVQGLATSLGMIMPEPGNITYLNASPNDAKVAAQRLASGEITSGAPSTLLSTPATTLTSTTVTAPTTVATTTPVATTTTTTPPVESAPPTTTTPTTTSPPPATSTDPATATTDTASAGTAATGGGTTSGGVSP